MAQRILDTDYKQKNTEMHEIHDEHQLHEDHNLGSGRSNFELHSRQDQHLQLMPSPTANPGPLGLLGFGLTTFLLNVHNAGGYEMNTMIIGMGLMFGGFAQLVAGLLEWKRGNLFPFIAFTSYGCFWISFILIFSWPATGKPDTNALGCYTFIWGVFSFGMWIATLKKAPWGLVVLFLTVWVLFFLLAIHFFSGSKGVLVLAGVEGIFCGLLAIYLAFCELLNEIYGRPVLPMGVRKQ